MKTCKFITIVFLIITTVFISCDNEDYNDSLQIDSVNLIAEDSELFNLLERATDGDEEIPVTCIDFVYSFILAEYTQDLELVASHSISSDTQFSEILDTIADGNLIGVSFPILSTLEDGTQIQINNKDELKTAIDSCVQEEQEQTIGYCNGEFVDCVWVVSPDEDAPFSTYNNAVFDANSDGTVVLFYRGEQYDGTWIFYYINDILHLNINLADATEVGSAWNFDWVNVITDTAGFAISNGDAQFNLVKTCDPEPFCTTLDFGVCETVDMPGSATTILEDYIFCISIIAGPQFEDPETAPTITYNFYNSSTDAATDVNRIDASSAYTLVSEETEVWVRITNEDDGSFEITTIRLSLDTNCE